MDFLFLARSEMDITSAVEIRKWFLKYRPDYCVNCAAYTQVDQAEKTPEPAYEVNVKGPENLARACREFGTKLVHISTDYVFDGKNSNGYLPGDTPNPINVYGRTKLEGELMIQKEMDAYFIIRTSWLYSKHYPPNFYLTILEKARKGETLSVTNAQRGCPTDAANLAQHILEIIKSETSEYGISHFTDGEAMTWFEFAVHILEQEGFPDYPQLSKAENYRTFAERPQTSILKNVEEKEYFSHEKAVIDVGSKIGKGTKIWHFSHIMPDCIIGEGCNIGQNVVISPWVVLGKNVKIQNNVSVYTGVICEDDVFLGPSMVFTNITNPRSAVNRRDKYLETLVKKGATIGANATIICGNPIGSYALVGAGTVVTKPIPDYALVVGNPGRQIGWVSEFGHRLFFDDKGLARCPESGQRYALIKNQVERIE